MFMSPNVIYLQMQKTGCTHIARLLARYEPGQVQQKHDQLREDPAGRTVFSSIRNPWDWYVSLWAYGSMGQGLLHRHFATDHKALAWSALKRGKLRNCRHQLRLAWQTRDRQRRNWMASYGDSSDAARFRRWLKMVLGDAGRQDLPEGYSESDINNLVGLMTYRYLRLCTRNDAWNRSGRHLGSAMELEAFLTGNHVCDMVVRMEHLEEDFAGLLQQLGHEVTQEELRAEAKTNTSQRQDYRDYYDAETIELVRRRDWLIVDKFGYDFAKTA